MNLETEIKRVTRNVPDFPKQGIQFKDITTLLQQPEICERIVDYIAKHYANSGVTKVAGIEARGFLFGQAIAIKMGVPFIMLRKPGKLPGSTIGIDYDLEYGSASLHVSAHVIDENDNILIHDDLLATGGTALAAMDLIRNCDASTAGLCFVYELAEFRGSRGSLDNVQDILSLAIYE